jgi:hypothetical protein
MDVAMREGSFGCENLSSFGSECRMAGWIPISPRRTHRLSFSSPCEWRRASRVGAVEEEEAETLTGGTGKAGERETDGRKKRM